jgi:hypothetical protein
MHPAEPKPSVPTVRLFPRIATPHTPRKACRPAPRRPKSAERTDSRAQTHSQLRARLLRMIIDNEQVRRNDQRPTAS